MSTTSTRSNLSEGRPPSDRGRPGPAVAGWFERTIVPPPVERLEPSVRSAGVIAVVVVLGVVASLLRHGPAVWATIWAEDGGIFLTEALRLGFLEALIHAYAGYVHAVPRLVTEAVTWFPLAWADTLLAVAGAGLAVLSGIVAYVGSGGHLHHRALRIALAVTIVLVPTAGGESPNSVAYAQWYLLAGALWLSVWRPATTRSAVGGSLYLLLVGLTAPMFVLLVPLLLARAVHAWLRRSTTDGLLAGGGLLGVALQLLAVATAPETYASASVPGNIVDAVLLRVTGPVFPGPELTRDLWLWFGEGALVPLGAAALLMLTFALVGADTRVRVLVATAVAGAFGLLLASDLSRGTIGRMVWDTGEVNSDASRYTIVPVVLLVSALLVRADLAGRRVRPGRSSLAVPAVVGLVALGIGGGYGVEEDVRDATPWNEELDTARETCQTGSPVSVVVPIVPAPTWQVEVPCERLLG